MSVSETSARRFVSFQGDFIRNFDLPPNGGPANDYVLRPRGGVLAGAPITGQFVPTPRYVTHLFNSHGFSYLIRMSIGPSYCL